MKDFLQKVARLRPALARQAKIPRLSYLCFLLLICWSDWQAELQTIALHYDEAPLIDKIDSYRPYFDAGLTPQEAWLKGHPRGFLYVKSFRQN